MIVKVQLSLSSNTPHRLILIYSKNKKICWQGEAKKEVVKFIDGRLKSFWHAVLEGTEVRLVKPAPSQDW